MTNDSILSHEEIAFKIKRIAFQIYETNVNEKEIIIIGIAMRGFIFAQKIIEQLQEISDLKITFGSLKVNKTNPLADELEIDLSESQYSNQSVVLIDDVLNSGTTLIYGTYLLLQSL